MTQHQQQRHLFTGADGITDNIALAEWLESARRTLHAAAMEVGITASELDARLRAVSGGLDIGGLSARARARQVTRPLSQCSEALIIASQYVVTAAVRFEAAYMPELDAAGHKPRKKDFHFKAGS